MKKISPPFTESEIDLIKGKYTTIANKHEVSSEYVRQIAIGGREINTDTAKAILANLKHLLTALNS